jgi:hypothetical protein
MPTALAAGIRDSSATVEITKVDLSVDQVVNRIVCWIHVGFGGDKWFGRESWQTEETKYSRIDAFVGRRRGFRLKIYYSRECLP